VTTAYVLSGGGSLGAVQVGMLQALVDRDIRPDLLVGTSVGALNATYLAEHGAEQAALERLAAIWSGLRRRDVFPMDPVRLAAAAFGRAPSLCRAAPLRRLVAAQLVTARLEDMATPIHIVTTDVASGREVLLSTGDAVNAVMASAAIPAVFPSVRVGGVDLVDGGVSNNAAVSQALALGADTVYVLPTGYACALDEPPATALSSALHALTLLIQQRLIVEVAHLADRADIRVVPPLCPLSVSSTDFRHGAALIDRARTATGAWLDEGMTLQPHPERSLSLHSHPRSGSDTHPSHQGTR
jgi:NTE family protein